MANQSVKPADKIELSEKNIRDLKKMSHLSEAEIRALFEGFRQWTSSGQLTLQEFTKLWNETAGEADEHNSNILAAERAFAFFDQDNSGKVDFNEFLTASVLLRRRTVKQKLTLLFILCDLNQDGFLSKGEIEKFYLTKYAAEGNTNNEDIEAFKAHLNKVFQQYDRNNDGKMSHKEFNNLCTHDEFFRKIIS